MLPLVQRWRVRWPFRWLQRSKALPGIFISYRRSDAGGHAGRLCDRLIKGFGAKHVFFDRNIDPGQDFGEAIQKHVDSAKVLIAVIGKDWLSAPSDRMGLRRLDEPEDFVRREIARALERGITVIPVLVGDAPPLRPGDVPNVLSDLVRRNAIEIRDGRWKEDVNTLVRAIEKVLPPAVATPWQIVIGGLLVVCILSAVWLAIQAEQPALRTVEFDVPLVDNQGEVIDHRRAPTRYYLEHLGAGVELEMVEIPGGSFVMGSPSTESGRSEDEGPQHQVTISTFYMARTE